MTRSKKQAPAKQPDSRIITMHYAKCEGFRTVHVDGVIGGPTPQGYLHMALFSERLPIPLEVDTSVSEEGKLGADVATRGKSGVFREIQMDAMLDLDTARALRDWLSKTITLIETDPRINVVTQKSKNVKVEK
ncbi:MAG: hypothetical protein IT463_13460 [Planctomycetes bacterium]|nr:hypothetical protein [Planctomycetota bacterium]